MNFRKLPQLLLLALPVLAQAQFAYTTNDGGITITAYMGWVPGGGVTIPSTINGLPVTRIADGVFKDKIGVTFVVIPDSITSIGNEAFAHCQLVSVSIPNSVTNIGDMAFSGCLSLKAIQVDPLNLIYSSAAGVLFDKSQTILIQYPGGKFESYVVPNSVTRIRSKAFAWTWIRDVMIPNSVTNIEAMAFSQCDGLTNVTILDGVTDIGYWAFSNCHYLTALTIGSGVRNIGDSAFYATALVGAYFEGNAPRVGYAAFGNDTIVYYLPGTKDWSPTFSGRPTALWVLPNPLILTSPPDFGVHTNSFDFVISWATNKNVVVEGTTNLISPWVPLATNTLVNGSSYFSDPEWTTYPSRFYRLRWP